MEPFFSSFLANFFWGLAAFVVFVLVLLKLGVKHVIAAIDARDAKIAKDLSDAEAANRKAQELRQELERKIRETEDKVGAMLAQARREADEARDALLKKGQSEVEQTRLRAQQDIEAARHAAIVSIRQEVADIAATIAGKIVTEKLDASRQFHLVGEAIDAYEKAKR
jgi:F-type H+-transporting ATPase subunit b